MPRGKMIGTNVALVGSEELSGSDDCHVYAIRYAPEKICLIDAGVRSSSKIIQNITDTFKGACEITHLILTHAHIDHIGAAHEFLARYPHLQIAAHQWDQGPIEGKSGTEKFTAASWYGITYTPVKLNIQFSKDEEELRLGPIKLKIYHTPGHTPGSISVLYTNPTTGKILFGQDVHGPFMREFNSNIQDWQASMKKLISLEPDFLCEGHFGVISGKDQVKNFIKSYLQQHQHLG
ncbi:MAG: MBL fold metallo-hydrolase [Promethearchaeota archaeon]|nr:MAG: MBL fold metallo-hydrolase [Candidatus Lokiarchaeota archaeon]